MKTKLYEYVYTVKIVDVVRIKSPSITKVCIKTPKKDKSQLLPSQTVDYIYILI